VKTDEQIGAEAAAIARDKILEQCRKVKLTPPRILQVIADALEATEVKTNYDKDRGKWSYSTPLVDHGKRLDAAELGVMLYDLKPPEKTKLDVNLKGDMTINVIDRFGTGKDMGKAKKVQPKRS
jgi:hypothetical protein